MNPDQITGRFFPGPQGFCLRLASAWSSLGKTGDNKGKSGKEVVKEIQEGRLGKSMRTAIHLLIRMFRNELEMMADGGAHFFKGTGTTLYFFCSGQFFSSEFLSFSSSGSSSRSILNTRA